MPFNKIDCLLNGVDRNLSSEEVSLAIDITDYFKVIAVAKELLDQNFIKASASILNNTKLEGSVKQQYSVDMLLAVALLKQEQYEQALVILDACLELRESAVALTRKGYALWQLDRYDEGLDVYEKGCSLQPFRVTELAHFGRMCNQSDQSNRFLRLLDKVCQFADCIEHEELQAEIQFARNKNL